jgi:hypothetical protein
MGTSPRHLLFSGAAANRTGMHSPRPAARASPTTPATKYSRGDGCPQIRQRADGAACRQPGLSARRSPRSGHWRRRDGTCPVEGQPGCSTLPCAQGTRRKTAGCTPRLPCTAAARLLRGNGTRWPSAVHGVGGGVHQPFRLRPCCGCLWLLSAETVGSVAKTRRHVGTASLAVTIRISGFWG